jgi:glyoxylase-like metal-dependent hydrolase (beta-lactamase superfamily II)
MRTLFLFVAFIGSCTYAQPIVFSRLAENAFVYTTFKDFDGKPFPSNSLYVVTDEGVVLVDTPWDESQFQPLLDSIQKRHNKKVVLCLSTHFHADRTAGLEYFRSKGIKTFTSKKTAGLCRRHKEKQPEFTFEKDTVFTVGGTRFETFYPGEGHAPDNIVVYIDRGDILYGGCLVKSTENTGLGNLSDANLKVWPRTIEKVIAKFPDPKFVIPGHFGWAGNRSLQHTLMLLRRAR